MCMWIILSLWFNNEEWCVSMFLSPYDDIINTANPFNLSLSLCWLYEGSTTVVSVGQLNKTHISILKLIEYKWKPAWSLHITVTKITKTIINIQRGITLTFLLSQEMNFTTISPFVDDQQILHVDQSDSGASAAELGAIWQFSLHLWRGSVGSEEPWETEGLTFVTAAVCLHLNWSSRSHN